MSPDPTTTSKRPTLPDRNDAHARELHVLIIDDDAADAMLVSRQLDVAGWKVTRTATLAEGERLLATAGYDVVVLDLALPDATGLNGLQRVTGTAPDVPVVVLTGREDDALGLRALQHGAQDYLEKADLQPSRLQRALNYAITRKQGERMRSRLAHTDRLASIGQLSAGIAHEINNPLAFLMSNMMLEKEHLEDLRGLNDALRAASEQSPELRAILTRVKLDERLQELAEMVDDNLEGVDRIRSVAKELRGFARAEQKQFSNVDLNEVVKTACNLTRNEVRHIAKLDLDLAQLPQIVGDYGRLCQLLVNLIVNAAHAIGDGSTTRDRISIRTLTTAEWVNIEVTDTGPGIAPEALPHLFDPFFTTKPREDGTGLGLSLCADTARLHNGSIHVQNAEHGGASFLVQLPQHTGLEVGAAPESVTRPTVEQPARVLLVDDDENVRRAFARSLIHRGHSVTEAHGGAQALRILDNDATFDAILCDLVMPDMDGSEFFEQLRTRHPACVQRVLFMSGGAFTMRTKSFIARERPLLLQKPATPQDIESAIHETVSPRPQANAGS